MSEPDTVRRLHILLVDSDQIARDKIQQALGTEFVMLCAASLAETRQCLNGYLPDAVICEVELDEESGLDICRYIRRMPTLRHLPLMLLTSLSTLQDKIAGFDAGADDYVVKPFDARHLVARIRLLLRIKRLEQLDNE